MRAAALKALPCSAALALALAWPAAVAAAPGDLDRSFSGDGRQTTGFANGAGDDVAVDMALQRDGRIVMSGRSDQGSTGFDFALARFRPNGALDTSFSGDGRQTTPFGTGTSFGSANAVTIQRDARIVAAGSGLPTGTTGIDFALARYKPNGSLDRSFSGDGKQTTAFENGAGLDGALVVTTQRDGKLVVAGRTARSGAQNLDFGIARYNRNGSLDRTFAGDGRQVVAFGNGAGNDSPLGVAVQDDGKIVVAGDSAQPGSGQDFALVRLKRNGTLDRRFGNGGRRTTDFAGGDDAATDLRIQPNGRLVLAGQSEQGAMGTDYALARYRPNGTLDRTFGGDGRATLDFGSNPAGDFSNGLALQRNGKIVVGGESFLTTGTGLDFSLARFRSNGAVDTSFAGDGRQTTSFQNEAGDDYGQAVQIQRNGRIVLAGLSRQPGTGLDFALARYRGDR